MGGRPGRGMPEAASLRVLVAVLFCCCCVLFLQLMAVATGGVPEIISVIYTLPPASLFPPGKANLQVERKLPFLVRYVQTARVFARLALSVLFLSRRNSNALKRLARKETVKWTVNSIRSNPCRRQQ